jgi:hypothetical protein
MEQSLGRLLVSGEKVLHRNGDRADNRLANLELVMPPTVAERFWSKVTRGEGCWEWAGRRHRQGYGAFWIGCKIFLAHRVAYELEGGAVPSGLCVCHRCDNPPCVNPAHLFLGTQRENVADMVSKGRGNVRLSAADIEEIKRLQAAGMYQRDIAARFGVCVTTVMRAAPKGTRGGRRGGTARKVVQPDGALA